MMLFINELRRFWGRRITWGIAIAISLLLVLAAVITFTQTSSPGDDDGQRQRAIEQAANNTQACIRDVSSALERGENFDDFLVEAKDTMSDEEFDRFLAQDYCYQDPSWYVDDNTFYATFLLGGDQSSDWSQTRPDGNPETYTQAGRQIRDAKGGLEGIIPTISVFFLVIAVVIGASFVGAEYKFGTVENLLLWEPRRSRVLLAKYGAGFLSSAALTALILAVALALFYLVASVKGSTQGVDSRYWIDMASTIFRSSIAGGLFFILAMSIAVLARNTTASVVAILGWFVVSNIVVELAAKWFRQWELFMNATAFISEGDAVRYEKIGNSHQIVYGHSYLTAGLIVAIWAGVFAVAAMVAFNRRDVD